MAVDVVGPCLDEDAVFGGRHNVTVEALEVASAGVVHREQCVHHLARLEGVAHDAAVAATNHHIVLTVVH